MAFFARAQTSIMGSILGKKKIKYVNKKGWLAK